MALFAASCDDPDTNRKFAESLGLHYPILSDPGGDVARAYGVLGKSDRYPSRQTFYIAKGGEILAVDRNVDPRSAGQDVLARVRDLGLAPKAKPGSDPGDPESTPK